MTVSRLRHVPGIGVDRMGDAADAADDPEILRLAGLFHGVGDRQVIDARHGVDRLAPVDPVGHEHRVDEVRRREARLANQAAQRAGGAQPAEAGLRERHD